MATAAQGTLTVRDELQLIERVFLRIASASTDSELETELQKFLPEVIKKLSSPSEAVRKKVMELLMHVNRRVKNINCIQLPVDALLAQYVDPAATSFVTNFAIIYIKMGYPRLDVNKKVELLPSLISCLEEKPPQHQDSLLYLMTPVFQHIKIAETAQKTASLFNLHDRQAITRTLAEYILDILLLPYGSTPLSQQGPSEAYVENIVPGVPAGMSVKSYKRICVENGWKPEELEQLKLSLVKFLCLEILPLSTIAVPLIVASSDTRFSVANAAELALRRLDSSIDWDNNTIVAALYVLFLGTLTPMASTPKDTYKNAANTRIRLKLMPFLMKSKEAVNYAPLALDVFYDCVFGTDCNFRSKHMGINFLRHIVFSANPNKLKPIGSKLFNGVVQLIDVSTSEPKLRSLAYGALASLSLKLPELLLSHQSELHYLKTLMHALSKEEGDVLLAVQEALSMVAPVCKQLNQNSQAELCVLLCDHVSHQNPQLRRTAVHYAATVFAHDHVPSRFILMIASGDSLDDISLEANRQLYKPIEEDKNGIQKFQAPSFACMASYVMERVESMCKLKWVEVAAQHLPYRLVVCEQIMKYLEHCLSVESTGEKYSDKQLFWDNSPAIGKTLNHINSIFKQEIVLGPKKTNVINWYLSFAEFAANAWSAHALRSIIRIIAVIPTEIVAIYGYRIDWIKKFIMRGGQFGVLAAHLFGLVAGHFTDLKEFEKALQSVFHIKDLRVECQETCIMAQGYSLCYKLHHLKKLQAIPKRWPLHEIIVNDLAGLLTVEAAVLQVALLTALGEISRHAHMPLVNKEGESTAKLLVDKYIKIFCNKKLASKIREMAISNCGFLCVGDPNFAYKVYIIESLLAQSKETKELEVHFAIGEALTDCILGEESESAKNEWIESKDDMTEDSPDQDSDEDVIIEDAEKECQETMKKNTDKSTLEPMEVEEDLANSANPVEVKGSLQWLLQELLDNYVKQSHPNCRQASCIWVLALLKKCKNRPEIQPYLLRIQETFMDFLGDNNDFIQDAASKGLGVVYECCSEAARQTIVESLVQSLALGRKATTEVTKDTKLFDEGELGKAPSGGQLSTYRELCSLATDLNQPDLIYKFMNLANHNAMWTSKKGAAFGFSSLASQAGTQLEPYLPQIIPKLYRYQHDPTPRIQQPMQSIWNSLVSDSAKTIEKYFEPILADLMSNITSNTWRVRESCCNAMTDLLRRISPTEAVDQVAEIWNLLFRLRDDIKESVRLAAEKTLQTFSKSCIKVCENKAKGSEEVLKQILPVLLTSGLTSSVTEVREISLTTLVKLCRSGGTLVKPHLGILIPAFLEALSGLEHTALSYTAVRVDEESRERLDAARILAAKSTPMMDTLNFVLQYVDETVIDSVIVGVLDVMKRSVGLSSRAGAAHVVETFTHTCPVALEKYTGKILASLVNGMADRNAVLRKTFANAIGKLVRTAKASSIEKLLNKLQSWYLEKEEESTKVSAALAIRSMHLQNGDIMKDFATQALPLTFLAMHAEKPKDGNDPWAANIWEEIWNDSTPGTEAAVKLYLGEILAICDLALQSNSWTTKSQAGRALSTVAIKANTSLSGEYLLKAINLLTTSLQGRTWAGKESLVTALADISLQSKTILVNMKYPNTDTSVLINVITILTKEASKDKLEYRIFALKGLTKVLEEYKVDRFEEIFNICLPYLSLDKDKKDDIDNEKDNYSKEASLRWELMDEMVHSLGRAWPATKQTQEKFSDQVIEMLSASVSRVPRKTQLSIVSALRNFWREHFFLAGLPESKDHALLGSLIHFTCKIFNFCLGVAKYYSLRKESLMVLNELLERIKGHSDLILRFQTELISSVEEAKRDMHPEIQSIATSTFKMLMLNQ